MELSRTIEVPCTPAMLMPYVADLDVYPSWMPLVHMAVRLHGNGANDLDSDPDPDPDPDRRVDAPAWSVELRARVGIFARSKQLRMVRTQIEPERLALFERSEIDGREHAMWALRAEISPVGNGRTSQLTMHLHYSGALWTGGLLERVLEDQIRRGTEALISQVGSSTTP